MKLGFLENKGVILGVDHNPAVAVLTHGVTVVDGNAPNLVIETEHFIPIGSVNIHVVIHYAAAVPDLHSEFADELIKISRRS